MRELARKRRAEYSIQTAAFGVREIRALYRKEKITIDIRKLPACLKAIYLAQDGDVSVAVRKDLPDEPKIFALVHESKHHWVDQELIRNGLVRCGDYMACTRFRRHRVRCFDGAGGGSWRDGSLPAS